VLACELAGKPGKKTQQALCTLESAAVAAAMPSDRVSPAALESARAVLRTVEAKLTGATLQLEARADGAIANLDLEGVDARDRQGSANREILRELLSRVVAGYHLKAKRGLEPVWTETHPALLQLPSRVGSSGFSEIRHHAARSGDLIVVQSLGGGSASMPVPSSAVLSRDTTFRSGHDTHSGGTEGADMQQPVHSLLSGQPPSVLSVDTSGPGAILDVEARFELESYGVAAYEADTGVLAERVWVVRGTRAGTHTVQFWSRGQFQLLGENDHPDVGTSRLVAPPQRTVEGLEPWPTWSTFD
jgi:hypothetical protein